MFYDRLFYLCKEKGVSVSSFARNHLGVSSSAPTFWKSGKIPNAEILVKIAKFFNVSVDYLVELTDDPSPRPDKFPDDSFYFKKRLAELAEQARTGNDLSAVKEFAELCSIITGVPLKSTVGNVSLPTIGEIAQFVGTSSNSVIPMSPMEVLQRVRENAPEAFPDINVRVPDDTMRGDGLPQGDIATFSPHALFQDGDICLALVSTSKGEQLAMIRRVWKKDDGFRLCTSTDLIGTLFPLNSVELLGKLTKVYSPKDKSASE